MLFHVYGDLAVWQWIAMLGVLLGLILLNEFARKTKFGGIVMFFVLPAILTAYFVAIQIGAAMGADWALNNQTYLYMNGWFHYAKIYAALAGCIGFMMIKYGWGIGKQHWFKPFPFVIVAINILIAVASDFETAIKGWYVWFLSPEQVWLYGGWHNVMNGIAFGQSASARYIKSKRGFDIAYTIEDNVFKRGAMQLQIEDIRPNEGEERED